MPVVPYRYSKQDLFGERYDYMYTPFEGAGLLAGYLEGRRDAVRRWTENGRAEPHSFEAAVDCARRADVGDEDEALIRSIPGLWPFETDTLLRTLWRARVEGRTPTAAWDEALLKRFEVTKRIYPAYRESFVRQSAECRHELYASLSAYFMTIHRKERDVRYLNAALKINDLLCSIDEPGWSPAGLLFALAGVHAEVEAVQQLLASHRIDLG